MCYAIASPLNLIPPGVPEEKKNYRQNPEECGKRNKKRFIVSRFESKNSNVGSLIKLRSFFSPSFFLPLGINAILLGTASRVRESRDPFCASRMNTRRRYFLLHIEAQSQNRGFALQWASIEVKLTLSFNFFEWLVH